MLILIRISTGDIGEGLADDGGYTGGEDVDGVHHFGVREGGYGHLEGDAGDAAEGLVDAEELCRRRFRRRR